MRFWDFTESACTVHCVSMLQWSEESLQPPAVRPEVGPFFTRGSSKLNAHADFLKSHREGGRAGEKGRGETDKVSDA